MARKRETINPSPDGAKPDKRNRKRFIIYAKEDGTPDLSNLPPELDSLRGGNSNQETGSTPPQPIDPPPPAFDSSVFQMILPVITGLEALLVAPRMGITVPLATQCLTPAPPLADAIATAAARVANKYAGSMSQYADEIALCAIIATWQVSAFAAMRRYAPIDVQAEAPPRPPDKHESYETPPPPPPKVEPEEN
jgi:hypothetical protein